MNTAATQPTETHVAATQRTGPLELAIAQTDHRANIEERAASFLGVSKENVCDLLRNCWKTSEGKPPLTKQEMFSGLSMIARYQLDPIAREVYVTRDNKGRLMTIIGIDGIIKVLDRTDHFDGFEQEYMFGESGEMEWCETRIYSKKRKHPTTYRAYWKEYAKLGGFMSKQIPWHMLRLFSLRHATRMFTPLGGVVTEEEARWMSQAGEPSGDAPPQTLDDITDRLTQPAKQQAPPIDDHCIEPAAEEPKPEPAEEMNDAMLESYRGLFADLAAKGECAGLLKDAGKLYVGGSITGPELAKITEMCGARQAEIGNGRGQKSNKKE